MAVMEVKPVERFPGRFTRLITSRGGQFGFIFSLLAFVLCFFNIPAFTVLERSFLLAALSEFAILVVAFLSLIELSAKITTIEGIAYQKLRVMGEVAGEGNYESYTLVALENPGTLRDDVLLTIYSDRSRVPQALGILRIVKSQQSEEILAMSAAASGQLEFLISNYKDGKRDYYNLFAVPMLQASEAGRYISGVSNE